MGWGISAPLQTDKLYDALGSTTFIALAIGTLTYAKYYYARQLLATVLVIIWAVRLGGFLVFRVIKTGRDSRFDDAKKQPCESPGWSPRRSLHDKEALEHWHVCYCSPPCDMMPQPLARVSVRAVQLLMREAPNAQTASSMAETRLPYTNLNGWMQHEGLPALEVAEVETHGF